jgi:hypothetical protein
MDDLLTAIRRSQIAALDDLSVDGIIVPSKELLLRAAENAGTQLIVDKSAGPPSIMGIRVVVNSMAPENRALLVSGDTIVGIIKLDAP